MTELRNYKKEFITERTVQRIFENARVKAGIKKKVSLHSCMKLRPNYIEKRYFGITKYTISDLILRYGKSEQANE